MSPSNRVLYLTGPQQVELREEPISNPGRGEILIRVDAATTCGTDLKVFLRGGHARMLQTPCPFGHEVTGTVAATGPEATGFREGDEVVVANSASCGACAMCRNGRENLCSDLHYLNGAFGEHLLIPARFVQRSTYRRPVGLDPRVAALAEPLACVFHGMSAVSTPEPTETVVIGAGSIGLMFVAELAHRGHRVVLGDLVPARLEVGRRLGAAETLRLAGDAADGARLRDATTTRHGAPYVIEATGVPIGWSNALETVGVGGTAVLFGGCAPGTHVTCDSHRIHYSEITIKGVYHHRPATFRDALDRLASGVLRLDLLLQEEHGLDGVEQALQAMAERRILKASIRP